MRPIPSFTINHLLLERGIYVSRRDIIGGEVITTFDIRMKRPNREPVVGAPELHTIEHLAATYLRNDAEWGERVIYWGPMGCQTGNYLILHGDLTPLDILPLMRRLWTFIADYEGAVPGATARDCGNHLLMNLPLAKLEAQRFLEVLNNITDKNINYPE